MKRAKKKKKKKTENKYGSYSHGVYSLVGETVLNQVITQQYNWKLWCIY